MVRKSYSTIYFLLVTILTTMSPAHFACASNKSVKPIPYTAKQLLSSEIRDTYEGDYLKYIAFPLGGIGTGCVGFSGAGKLVNWEIFNNANKGYQPRQSFISIWAKAEGEKSVFKVLEGQLTERLDGPVYLTEDMWYLGNGAGPQQTQGAGLPRMRDCKFVGRFPFAKVNLEDTTLPLKATVEGWSPFIPNNDKDSSIPAAIFYVNLQNTTNKTVEATLAMNVQNRAGKFNEIIREPGFCAMYMNDGAEDGNSMFIGTTEPVTTWQTNWQSGNLFLSLEHFTTTFAATGQFDSSGAAVTKKEKSERHKGPAVEPENQRGDNLCSDQIGSIGIQLKLAPGQSKTVPLILGWYFPVFDTAAPHEYGKVKTSWKNYYAMQWKSGLDVAKYVVQNLGRLEKDTRLFQKTFFSSTLPGTVLESISSTLCVLRSPTVIRYPDGTLYGWEGCAAAERLGYGTCSHVWHYQQAVAYLFPKLQRSMLENFFFNGMRESDGAVQFRIPVGPSAEPDMNSINAPYPNQPAHISAADGQLGQVCQVYRDWLISGDNKWLKKMWPRAKKALEYTWVEWDKDRDGLLEGPHHNTLDLNLSSAEPFCGSIYQAALLVGEKLARHFGEEKSAKEYRRIYELGKKLTDEKLFNGEFYHQMLPAEGIYQLGNGCISEQVHGQLYSKMLGLDDVFDAKNIHKALGSLFKYNYFDNFYDFINVFRAYSIGSDRGLVIATWPKGGRPEQPLLYCDETMSGFEYQVAGNLLYDGYILEGLTVIKSIRDRHNGRKRNPYDEFEWGRHYARTMANYSSLLALSGWRYCGSEKTMQLDPQVNRDDFIVFFSVDDGWGTILQKKTGDQFTVSVEVAKGKVALDELVLCPRAKVKNAAGIFGTKSVNTSVETIEHTVAIKLDETVEVTPEQPLTIKLTLE